MIVPQSTKTQTVAARPAAIPAKGYGIDNATPMVALVAKIVTALVHADKNNNGKLDASERFALIGFLSLEVYTAFSGMNLNEVGNELRDLDKDEVATLVAVFSLNHDLKDEQLEQLIENTLDWLVQGIGIFASFRVWRESKQTQGFTLPSMERLQALNAVQQTYSPRI